MPGASGRLLLFDLDGTLTDPFEGITRSIAYAMERLGRTPPNADDLRWCIGPPLSVSFVTLLDTDDREEIDRAVGFYRELIADHQNPWTDRKRHFPGVNSCLMGRSLVHCGFPVT